MKLKELAGKPIGYASTLDDKEIASKNMVKNVLNVLDKHLPNYYLSSGATIKP